MVNSTLNPFIFVWEEILPLVEVFEAKAHSASDCTKYELTSQETNRRLASTVAASHVALGANAPLK